MTFRDDGDAARARADALQRDLDHTQDELDAAKQKLETAERRLASVEAENQRLASTRAGTGPKSSTSDRRSSPVAANEASEPASDARRPSPPSPVIAVLAIVGGLSIATVAFLAIRRAPAHEPEKCTLRTYPQGATVIARCQQIDAPVAASDAAIRPNIVEIVRGTTPLTQERVDWSIQAGLCGGMVLLRLPGYREQEVRAPIDGTSCRSVGVIQLTPEP